MKREPIGKVMYGEHWKCTLQFLSELRGTLHTKTTHKHIVWNNSHFAH